MAAVSRWVLGSRTRAWFVVGLWLVLAGVVPRLAPSLDSVKDTNAASDAPAGAESSQARTLLTRAFPEQNGTPAVIVVRNPTGLSAADGAEVARITDALNSSSRPARVRGAVSTATVAPAARAALVSRDGTTTTILVSVAGQPGSDESFLSTVDSIRKIAGTGDGQREIRVTGPAAVARDAISVFANADLVLLAITVGLVLVLLLVIYRSPLLAVLPLVGVGIGMELTNAIGAALAKAGIMTIDSQTASIMTVLLFGAGTDYALFVTMRYREELATGPDRYAAMRTALTRVGPAVLSSGVTVVLAMLSLLLAVVPSTRQLGAFLALGVALTLLVGLTFIPAAVVLLGRAALWPMKTPERVVDPHSGWGRVGGAVLRRPATLAVVSLALLAALAGGLFGFRLNADQLADFRTGTDSLRGQHLLVEAFPAGQLSPTTVLVDGGGRRLDDPATAPALAAIVRSVAAVPGVSTATPPDARTGGFSAGGTVARIQVVYADDPTGGAALDRTGRVRTVARRATAAGPLAGSRVLVGGESATALDRRTADLRDLVVVATVMAGLILIVLLLLLRAVIAPLILLATTVLSLLSALGITTLVWITGAGQAGADTRVLLYTLVFLVALGVDYNILLANRMREEVAVHGHREGIRRAVAASGGVITSAGIILAGTFAVLTTQPVNSLLQFGFAMSVGILLDTFLVRGLLVPALIRLVGPAAWWPARPVAPTLAAQAAAPGAPRQPAVVPASP